MAKNRLHEYLHSESVGTSWAFHSRVGEAPVPVVDLEKMYNDFFAALQGSILHLPKRPSVGKSVQITGLRSREYRLKMPIPIYLEEENDAVTATWYDIGQYGTGPSEDDAIADLCNAIIQYYKLLKREEAKLSEILRGHLHCLESTVGPADAA